MEFHEIAIKVPCEQCETASAIANMVVPYGIYVEDYSDLEQGAEEIAHINLIDEELLKKDRSHCIIHVYITEEENVVESLSFLEERFTAAGVDYYIDQSVVCDSDWRDNWKKFFKVTNIGKRLVIRPSWEEFINTENRVVLNIDPGVAFGTGTHATTSMCLELLDRYVTNDVTILDIGCGSGILSMSGVMLGAKEAVGVDIDAAAVKVSTENAKLNNISDKCRFIKGNLADEVTGCYDIICANIVADAVISLLSDAKKFMHDNSLFICSGIIDTRAKEVIDALEAEGLEIVDSPEKDGWHAYSARIKK